MKILITGSKGMLGRALCENLVDVYDVVGVDINPGVVKFEKYIRSHEVWNITNHEEFLSKIRIKQPDVVIHAAAYTDVDGCESEEGQRQAEKVNVLGTKNVAQACKECNCLLIYVSTDFVFDGEKNSPYIESDPPNPINAYGKSKLEGEKLVQSILEKFIIVRSSWLFGKGGKNFVSSILQKAKRKEEIKVVSDQRGSPTYTLDLASAIAKLIQFSNEAGGIYHITSSGSCSWYEFALAIKELAGLNVNITPVSSKEYPSPTKRPKMSALNNQRYLKLAGESLRNWKQALKEYLQG